MRKHLLEEYNRYNLRACGRGQTTCVDASATERQI